MEKIIVPTKSKTTKISFSSPIEKALFDEELSGQISDDLWENTRNTEWLWSAETELTPNENAIQVSPGMVGKTGYSFSKLIEYVGDRMLEIGKRFDIDYSEKKLRKNLKNISKIIKMARSA